MSIIKESLFLESNPNMNYFSENQKNEYKKLKNKKDKETCNEVVRDWNIYRNDGIWQQSDTATNYKPVFDVDTAIRKTFEHKYTYETYLKIINQVTQEEDS